MGLRGGGLVLTNAWGDWEHVIPGLKIGTSTPASKDRSPGTPETGGTLSWIIILPK
jgi:hypothetical protein